MTRVGEPGCSAARLLLDWCVVRRGRVRVAAAGLCLVALAQAGCVGAGAGPDPPAAKPALRALPALPTCPARIPPDGDNPLGSAGPTATSQNGGLPLNTDGDQPTGPGQLEAQPRTDPTRCPSERGFRSAPRDQAPPELPRGGRTLFPRYRLVGYAGREGAEALGRLGIGSIDARGAELVKRARAYADGRRILPVFELVATVATSFPTKDGRYRVRADDRLVGRYLAAARRHRALLLLNIQPGRADFLPEVKAYGRWLREPDVGVALDPEWAVGGGQVPGQVYGRTTGKELDGVARYLSAVVTANDLPEKALVFHQVAASVVREQGGLRPHPGVVIVKSVDGIGSRGAKETTWRTLTTGMPKYFHAGFKLFFEEDRRQGALMTPAQVLALRPEPDYVMYE